MENEGLQLMKEQKTLYTIILILTIIVIALFSFTLGGYMGAGYMGSGMTPWNDHMGGYAQSDREHMMGEHMLENSGNDQNKINYNKPIAETHNSTHDFGKIKKSDGVISTTFEIENHGKESLVIGKISTSCACTSAKIDKKTLGFNEEAILTVYFDPNFHKESSGEFVRSVFVPTNDPDLTEMQFDIAVEIVE